MYRFALGPLPLLAVVEGDLIARVVHRAIARPAARWAWLVACATAMVFLCVVHATRPNHGDHYQLYKYQKEVEIPVWSLVGKWFAQHADTGCRIAAVPIGAVGYYSGLPMLDMLGLTDAHIARRTMPNMGNGWAGHEKHDGQYILSRKPRFLLLGNIDVTYQPRNPAAVPFIPYSNPSIWEREKDIYDLDMLVRLYRPRSAEIAPGIFLNFYEAMGLP